MSDKPKDMNCMNNWSSDKHSGPRGPYSDKGDMSNYDVVAKVEDRKTVKIDEKKKCVLFALNPRLYPQTVVMRASYRFIDDFDVIVDGDPLSTISVTIKAKKEDGASYSELEELAAAFFRELIHANVEETQARRYADTRNALIGAALRSMMPSVAAKEKSDEKGTKKPDSPGKTAGKCGCC
ncbi:MAG: hypothetical protein U9Q92_01495 [archaeon]|nr:hypothetical protein [archaeon]